MAQPVIMPKLGQTAEEVTLVRWHKREGDTVHKGDVLFEIETDKAVLEIESFFEGTLLKVLVGEGMTVPVFSPVAFIGTPGEPLPALPLPPPASQTPARCATRGSLSFAPRGPAPPEAIRATAPAAVAPPAAPPVAPPRLRLSPRARALARACAIDPAPIRGTGPDGRILERDVRTYLAERGYERLRITPGARALAVQEGVDILGVRGTGGGGRIVVADVERAVAMKPRPLAKRRQIIARRLTQSFTTTPHFYVTVSADVTELMAWRQQLKAQGRHYSVTDFVLQAVVWALTKFPTLHSTTDGTTIRWHGPVHLGVAVALDDGLVVPVIRYAEELTFDGLHAAAQTLIEKAQAGTLLPDEMTGSTFTVSNLGMMNVENFAAIINPGEAAILAVASAREQPVVYQGAIQIRSLMKMTLSADHRIVDGHVAAAFINHVRQQLEDRNLWNRLISL